MCREGVSEQRAQEGVLQSQPAVEVLGDEMRGSEVEVVEGEVEAQVTEREGRRGGDRDGLRRKDNKRWRHDRLHLHNSSPWTLNYKHYGD